MKTRLLLPRWLAASTLSVLIAGLTVGAPAEKKEPAAERVVAGKCVSSTGLLRRPKSGKDWKVVKKDEKLYTGDLLVAGAGAAIQNTKGTVRINFLGNLQNTSPLPILETAVVLRKSPDVDLDFTLDRGRADVTNLKKKSKATVRVHVRDEVADLTLNEPGARCALEVHGRWPAGTPFVKDPRPGYGPGFQVLLLVLEGSVEVKGGRTTHHLTAPPGPALIYFDSANGLDATPQRLEKLPDWASDIGGDDADAKKRKAALVRLRKLAATEGVGPALDTLADSDEPADRRLAVFAMGALDDLERLGNVLTAAKHADAWDNGVVAMRHWIGRGPGQDQILYRRLQERRKYSPAHAETVLQLLHSFSEEQLAQPATYEVLIEYLGHDKLAIRGLAHWHLVRLVPAGRKIAYHPLGEPAERAKAQEEWRKLVPPGSLPPKPKTGKVDKTESN
jgi:hypothetical protein